MDMFAQPDQSAPRAQEPVPPANLANSIRKLTETGDKFFASFPKNDKTVARVQIMKDGIEFYSITFDSGRVFFNLDIYELLNKLCEIEAYPEKY